MFGFPCTSVPGSGKKASYGPITQGTFPYQNSGDNEVYICVCMYVHIYMGDRHY